MTRLVIVAALLFLTLPSISSARAECYDGLKDMLDGTLEVANSADRTDRGSEPADGHRCTLATWEKQDAPGQRFGNI